MTTTTLHVTLGPDAATQIGAQVARTVRRYGPPTTTVRKPPPVPAVPFRHADLFREAAYEDGQPYGRDDEDDEDE